jgi:mRNA-degrading endonuclease RelE of RelBE toxin-antitoxin system
LRFQIKIDIDAFNDIQETFEWYEMHLKGLGLRYKTETKKQINSLQKDPYLFSIKYNEIRCRKIKKFPFLIHYTIDDSFNIITILAVFHTSRNPEIWKKNSEII